MVSMATVKFKQKQQRTGNSNRFVLLRSPITCSELLVYEVIQNRLQMILASSFLG